MDNCGNRRQMKTRKKRRTVEEARISFPIRFFSCELTFNIKYAFWAHIYSCKQYVLQSNICFIARYRSLKEREKENKKRKRKKLGSTWMELGQDHRWWRCGNRQCSERSSGGQIIICNSLVFLCWIIHVLNLHLTKKDNQNFAFVVDESVICLQSSIKWEYFVISEINRVQLE